MLRAQMYGCGAGLPRESARNPPQSLRSPIVYLLSRIASTGEDMPDKQGWPLKGEPGYETSARAKSNAKNNAKNSAKVQKRAREEATERISKMPRRSEDVLSPEAAFEVAKMILRKSANAIIPPPILKVLAKAIGIDELSQLDDGVTLIEILTWAAASFYVGYTARCLPDEALRWLTTRGLEVQDENGEWSNTGARNRPVLTWADGTCITMSNGVTRLGFDYFEVYASTLKINARAVEKALQVLNQALPLGIRLWRCPDKGSKFDKKIDGKLHKVYITVSPHIGDMVRKGEIMINE